MTSDRKPPTSQELSRRYKDDPSLENYARLRRLYPDVEIEVAVHGGIDPLFAMQDELKRYGFDPNLVVATMDADQDAISELSLQLIERVLEGRALKQQGESSLVTRGLAVPEKLIDWLIAVMLDSLSWNDYLRIPRDLIVLIRERNGGTRGHYQDAVAIAEARLRAVLAGAALRARGESATLRSTASAIGVAPSTVKRWFAPGEFEQEVDRWASKMDNEGRLVRLYPGGPLLRENKDAQHQPADNSHDAVTSTAPEKPADDPT